MRQRCTARVVVFAAGQDPGAFSPGLEVAEGSDLGGWRRGVRGEGREGLGVWDEGGLAPVEGGPGDVEELGWERGECRR